MKCIICREEADSFSDEHVIPESIGGYYHIYNVCKTCNDGLGSNVDSGLVNHKFMQFQRQMLGISGKKGSVPDPLAGTHRLKDEPDVRVRLELDSDGCYKPYVLPCVPGFKNSLVEDKFTIIVDKADEQDVETILGKFCQRNGIARDELKFDGMETRKTSWVSMNLALDVERFKLGLLKIAYEYAVDSVPEYFEDESAVEISRILRNPPEETLTRLFLGNGIDDKVLEPFSGFIPFDDMNHYLFLVSLPEKGLICFIRLFNTFNIGVSLSSKHFDLGNEGNILIGINDFKGKEFIKTDLTRFIADNYTSPELRFSYYFRDEDEAEEFLGTECRPDFGFFTVGNDIPLFDSTGKVVYADVSQKTLQRHLVVKDLGDFRNEIITQVEMDEELYIKVLPSMRLLRVVAIRVEQYRKNVVT